MSQKSRQLTHHAHGTIGSESERKNLATSQNKTISDLSFGLSMWRSSSSKIHFSIAWGLLHKSKIYTCELVSLIILTVWCFCHSNLCRILHGSQKTGSTTHSLELTREKKVSFLLIFFVFKKWNNQKMNNLLFHTCDTDDLISHCDKSRSWRRRCFCLLRRTDTSTPIF
jgi:hypothetical protein